MAGHRYVVRQGDTCESIAARFGHFWQTLWDDDANAELRAERPNPNVLEPGDVVFVPALRRKTLLLRTNKRHVVRRRGVPSRFTVVVRDVFDEPRRSQPFRILTGESAIEGMTDVEGRIDVPLPPLVRRLELRVGSPEDQQTWVLDVGHVDPIDSPAGVAQRLAMLGFLEHLHEAADHEPIAAAVERYRHAVGLLAGRGLDDELRAALLRDAGA